VRTIGRPKITIAYSIAYAWPVAGVARCGCSEVLLFLTRKTNMRREADGNEYKLAELLIYVRREYS
jgi:hypothetical protein